MTALPDFLIIGAMKCGTTTLQAQLATQPGIFMTTPKEPNFFSDDDVFAQGMDWYGALFDGASEGALKGEASTHYTKLPTHPETLLRMAPVLEAPKLIYMIRDPVARAVSHYMHEWSLGVMGHDPVAAFKAHPELVAYGSYGMQIAPFVAQYGIENILLTSLEQIKTTPEAELARIGDFLGAGTLVWQKDMEAQNVSSERFRRFRYQKLLIDNPVAEALRRNLVPKSLRRWVRKARTIKERPEIPESLRAEMQTAFLKDRVVLADNFPSHPALDLSYPFVGK